MPEWYFLLLFLGLLTTLGASWTPLFWLSPLLVAGVLLTLIQAAGGGYRASFHSEPRSKLRRAAMRFLVAWFHLVQPAARLLGRVQHGLGPWNWRNVAQVVPLPSSTSLWSVRWEAIGSRLSQLESILRESAVAVIRGGDFDSWDLSIRGGLFGGIRVVSASMLLGQMCRFRAWPKAPAEALVIILALIAMAGFAALDGAAVAGTMLALLAGVLGFLIYADCALAMSQWREAVDTYLHRDHSLSVVAEKASAKTQDSQSAAPHPPVSS
jgi:hypothetical protein